jgi:hypothetical protein
MNVHLIDFVDRLLVEPVGSVSPVSLVCAAFSLGVPA